MREVLFSAVLFGFIGFCAPAGAQEHIAREYIEWSDVWLTGANQTGQASRPVARQFHHERVSPQSRKVVGRQSLRRAAFRFEECGRPCLAR